MLKSFSWFIVFATAFLLSLKYIVEAIMNSIQFLSQFPLAPFAFPIIAVCYLVFLFFKNTIVPFFYKFKWETNNGDYLYQYFVDVKFKSGKKIYFQCPMQFDFRANDGDIITHRRVVHYVPNRIQAIITQRNINRDKIIYKES